MEITTRRSKNDNERYHAVRLCSDCICWICPVCVDCVEEAGVAMCEILIAVSVVAVVAIVYAIARYLRKKNNPSDYCMICGRKIRGKELKEYHCEGFGLCGKCYFKTFY